MLVITGPGRSGTSVLAALYRELGFPLGGVWTETISAGFEDTETVILNNRILDQLDLFPYGKQRRFGDRRGMATTLAKKVMSEERRYHLRRRMETGSVGRLDRSGEFPWERLQEVADIFRDEIVALGAAKLAVKDPHFTWTLPVWIAAGVRPDFVVATNRQIDDMVASRQQALHLNFSNLHAARNSIVYGLGLLQSTLQDCSVPHVWLRFPDFLADPQSLYDSLVFPGPVSLDDFTRAFDVVVLAGRVHHGEIPNR